MQQLINRLVNALLSFVPFFRHLSAPIKPMPSPPPTPPGIPPTPTPTPVPPGQSPPPLNILAIAYAHLVGKYLGQFVNVDRNPYGAQCVEIVQAWCDILGIERFPGNAADFEFDAHPDCTWTANTPTNVPPVGSIVVWGKSPTLPFGHVGVSGVADSMKFTSFDQNWPLGSSAHQQAHTYGGVRGWLTPILSHVKYRPPGAPPAPTPTPVPVTSWAHFMITARDGLSVNTGPHLSAARIKVLPHGTMVTINCQTSGDLVGSSRVWDHIVAPVTGYISDYWVDTPGVGVFLQGVPRC